MGISRYLDSGAGMALAMGARKELPTNSMAAMENNMALTRFLFI
jgi:hypothetical protein